MQTLVLHPENQSQLTALKAVAKALNVKFKTEGDKYDPDFVDKIKKTEKELLDGKYTVLDPAKSLWENLQ